MRYLLLLLACTLLLSACSTVPAGAGAIVTLDRCGQPVVVTRVEGIPAGSSYLADTEVRVYRPCELETEED
jgi:uncharacterized protein YceK